MDSYDLFKKLTTNLSFKSKQPKVVLINELSYNLNFEQQTTDSNRKKVKST